MEEKWRTNMRHLLGWALKKGFEYPYPMPISSTNMSYMLAELMQDEWWEKLMIGEIEHPYD